MMSALSESLSANWRKVEGWVSGRLSVGKFLMKEEHLSGTLFFAREDKSIGINSCNVNEFWSCFPPVGVMILLSMPSVCLLLSMCVISLETARTF